MEIPQLYKMIVEKGANIHIDTLYKARQRGCMTKKLALLCEEVTGIPREKWVFPEKFGNPWDNSNPSISAG